MRLDKHTFQYVVIFITAGSGKEAKRIARRLVDERLVACANVLGEVDSIFWWKGKQDRAKERLLIAKTERSRLDEIVELVNRIHSYELPEIIALPIVGASQGYLDWIKESVKRNK